MGRRNLRNLPNLRNLRNPQTGSAVRQSSDWRGDNQMVNSTGIIAGPKRDLVGYEGNPPKVAWPGGAKIAISLVVNYEEGSELAIGDGDATREPSGPASWPITKRDLAGEGAVEDGSRAGYWRAPRAF